MAVELALLDASITVHAIELKPEACELIRKNVSKFSLSNLNVIEGTAPDALADLPAPTHVFIGGSAGRLEDIIHVLRKKGKDIRIVVNAVTIETVADIYNVVRNAEIKDCDFIQVSVNKAKSVGDYNIMQGQNPVYIASFTI